VEWCGHVGQCGGMQLLHAACPKLCARWRCSRHTCVTRHSRRRRPGYINQPHPWLRHLPTLILTVLPVPVASIPPCECTTLAQPPPAPAIHLVRLVARQAAEPRLQPLHRAIYRPLTQVSRAAARLGRWGCVPPVSDMQPSALARVSDWPLAAEHGAAQPQQWCKAPCL
jgi:hypothetical protein